MKVSNSRNVVGIVLLLLVMLLTVSYEAMGHGRRGRRVSQFDKKCGKFVNCHDARDGRWDGRGPRRSVSDRFDRRSRRHRDRDGEFDRNGRRRRMRDRDWDRDWRRR